MSRTPRILRFALLAVALGAFELVVFGGPAALAQESEGPLATAPHPAAWWVAFVPIAWAVLTAIINTIAHYETPADVDAWAEKNPRLAQLLSIIRRAGFEPIAMLGAFYGFFAGNPPPPGHAAAIGRRYESPRSKGFALVGPMAALAALGLVVLLGVSIAPRFTHGRVPSIALVGCTPAQSAADATVAKTILTDAQKACVFIEAALPYVDTTLGLPPATVTIVDDSCGIVGVADSDVANAIATGAGSAGALAPKLKARLARMAAARAAGTTPAPAR